MAAQSDSVNYVNGPNVRHFLCLFTVPIALAQSSSPISHAPRLHQNEDASASPNEGADDIEDLLQLHEQKQMNCSSSRYAMDLLT